MNPFRFGRQHAPALLLLLAGGLAQAASFDCAKARSDTEKRICADPAVSQLDGELALAYRDTLAAARHKAALKGWQKQWLVAVRDNCADAACLKRAYADQITELREHRQAVAAGGGVSGRYDRQYENKVDKTGTIEVFALLNGRVRLVGSALWYGINPDNVHVGEINGVARLDKNVLQYRDGDDEYSCKLTISFSADALRVSGDNGHCGGHNVTFDDAYRRAAVK
ncbi:MAG: lysozyme inhibitor LprI family protein [Pseudomonadota bacterium]